MSVSQNICRNFSRKVDSYDQAAEVQARAAKQLAKRLSPKLPPGPILEIGCGTGLLSQHLAQLYPEREIHFTDLSPAMVEATQQRLGKRASSYFYCLNGEELQQKAQFSGIFSSFTLQWFTDLKKGLKGMQQALLPGGHLGLALQGEGSYREWRSACKSLGLPFAGNPLPSLDQIALLLDQWTWHFHRTQWENHYPRAIDFFNNIKQLGANTPLSGKRLTFGQFKALLHELDQNRPCAFSTEVLLIEAIKP